MTHGIKSDTSQLYSGLNKAALRYFSSIALNFVFYYNFDRMFRFYFRKWIFKEVKSATPTASASGTTAKAQISSKKADNK
jgi:hypothetical protein